MRSLTEGLDPIEAGVVEHLAAADAVAAANRIRRPNKRWRDPILIVLMLFGIAIILLSFAVQTNSKDRSRDVQALSHQIDELHLTIDKLVGQVTSANHQIAVLQQRNHQLLVLVRRLCEIDPGNTRCATIATASKPNGSPQSSPAQTRSNSARPVPSTPPGPTPTPPRPTPHPSPPPQPSPTPLLCLPKPLPYQCLGLR